VTPAVASVIDAILDSEGGIADVGDGKGVTRFGQTPQWLETHSLPIPSNRDQAFANYALWMNRLKLDAICAADQFAGLVVTDMAVHFGESTAIKTMQRALGVPDDGVIGVQTLARFSQVGATRRFYQMLLAQKGKAYGDLLASLTVDRRRWARGWMNRFAQQIQDLP
jgi:lysozyme family protein